MKWIAIGLIALVLIGGLGFVAVKTGWFATAKEDVNAWMDEEQLKNFPAVAREEIKKMEDNLKEQQKSRSKLKVDIGMLKGTDTMTDAQLKDDSDGFATIRGYELLKKEKQEYVDARDKVIKATVAAVKQQQADYLKNNPTVTESGAIPADHQYEVVRANGETTKMSLADIKAGVAKAAKEIDAAKAEIVKYDDRIKRLSTVVSKMEGTVAKVEQAIASMTEKIDEMKLAAKEIEAEIKLAQIEQELDKINAAIEGKESDSRLGNMIAKFKKSQKEAAAARDIANQEKAEAEKGSGPDLMGGSSSTGSGSTSADDYWK